MKCIKTHGPKVELKRLSDSEAMKLVDGGKASYIPKSLYKEAHGKGPAETPRTNHAVRKVAKKNDISLT